MKRKLASIALSALMATSLLSACGGDSHTHAPTGDWEWTGTEHWHLCECGEKADAKPHNVDDDLICADCGVELWDMGDGCIDAISYDEDGNLLRWVSFDADGNITSEQRYERIYDDAGNLATENFYVDGFLQDENTYVTTEDGMNYLASCLNHHEDGYTYLNEYDMDGNLVKLIAYDPEGNVESVGEYEYQQDENGEFYESKVTEHYGDTTYVATYNDHRDPIQYEVYENDVLVQNSTVEHEYDAEGNTLWEKQYTDGVLVFEIVQYAEVETEDYFCRYPEITVDYYEDGTKMVQEFGENTNVAVETMYNADGSVAYVYTYTYEANEHGGETVTVTDQNGEIISQTVYDADGNEVE